MDNQILIRALAAHTALCDSDGADARTFLKRADDAFCLIEAYAYDVLEITEDHKGTCRFSRKPVDPNMDAKTARKQPIAA